MQIVIYKTAKRLCLLSLIFYSSSFWAKPPLVTLFTDPYPPYIMVNEDKSLSGSAIEKVKKIFEKADISYEIKLVPWNRMFLKEHTDENLMLFPLARFKERENQFQWILPLHSIDLKLYGRSNNLKTERRNLNDPKLKFACTANTVHCEALRANNIPESSITTITSVNNIRLIKLLMQGRFTYVVMPEVSLLETIEELGLTISDFSQHKDFNYQVVEYLVTRTELTPGLKEKLQKAAEDLSYQEPQR